MPINAVKGIPTCPVQCEYCMAQKIDIRAGYWKNAHRIGMNRSTTFISRLPQDPPLEEMSFPWELFEAEYIGYQGITDCFWDIFKDDLRKMVMIVDDWDIRKLTLVSKIPPDDEQLDILFPIKDKLITAFSLTGLDDLEKTSSADRLKAMVKMRDLGMDVAPIIHPYIHGYCPIDDLMHMIADAGFDTITWKGFRYNPETMKSLEKKIPKEVLNAYRTDEQEDLHGEDTLLETADKYGLHFVVMKDYIHKDPHFVTHKTKEEFERDMKEKTEALSKICLFSTSGTREEVMETVLQRRLAGVEYA